MLEDLLARLSATQPTPTWQVALSTAAVAVALVASPGYRIVRHLTTLLHEAGHALLALLSGRQLTGIKLHSDTSGVTISKGRPRGFGMIATVAAGYPAPAFVGLAGMLLVNAGRSAAFLWLLVLLSAALLVLIRNLYGLWVVLVTGLGVGALSWFAPADALGLAAQLVVWVLLLAAPRAVLEMSRTRRRPGGQHSDADQLAGLTRLPAVVWVGWFAVVCLGALGYASYQLWLSLPWS